MPLNIEKWKKKLKAHPDKTYVETILWILEIEVKIDYQNSKTLILNKNLASIDENPNTFTKDLKNQMLCGKIIKLKAPWENFISFPLNLTPKSNEKWRRIHHLFHFKNRSVNCNIFREWKTLKYSSVDETIEMLLKVSFETLLIKKNLLWLIRQLFPIDQRVNLLANEAT